MELSLTKPGPQALIVASLGLGQMLSFGSSFYLLSVLGDRSEALAMMASSAVSLGMFAMTFGLTRRPHVQPESATA